MDIVSDRTASPQPPLQSAVPEIDSHCTTDIEYAEKRGLTSPDLHEGLVALLEDHRRRTKADIVEQFESIATQTNSILQILKVGATSINPREDLGNGSLSSPRDAPSVIKSEVSQTVTDPPGRRISFTDGTQHLANITISPRFENVVQGIMHDAEAQENGGEEEAEHSDDELEEIGVQISMKSVLGGNSLARRFDICVALIISASVLVMIIELEYESAKSQATLGNDSGVHEWGQNAEFIFKIVDHIFNVLFVLELVVRLWLFRWKYFAERLNLVDFFLVFSTCVQLYILEPFDISSGGRLTLFRMIRFLRFTRVFKVMRLPIFAELRMLVKTCVSSIGALSWSMVLLFLLVVIGGLFLCNLLKSDIQDEHMDYELRKWLFMHYGSAFRASYTLFEVTLAGCWPNYFRPLIERVSGWYVLFALGYITIVVFAVIRIITAFFLKQTLQVASHDADMMVQEQRSQREKCIAKLRTLFQALDIKGNGVLTRRQFTAIMKSSDVRALLQTLELEVYDVEGLFHLLDDGDGKLIHDEFIQGILRLRGQARSLDIVSLARHCDKLEVLVNDIASKLDEVYEVAVRSHSSRHL